MHIHTMHNILTYKVAASCIVVAILGSFLWAYAYARDRIRFEPAFVRYEVDSLRYSALYALHSRNSGPNSAEASGPGGSVPILVYHGVEAATVGGEYDISPERFREHLFALKDAGYETISLAELYDFKQGRGTLPEKPVVITFDDGRRDSYYGAGPILNALDFEASMFAISRYAGQKRNDYYMDLAELRRMNNDSLWYVEAHARDAHDEGYKIGPASFGPFYANLLWKDEEQRLENLDEYRTRVASDMAATQHELEERLGTEITAFAFPFGEYGQNRTNDARTSPILLEEASKLYHMLFFQEAPGVHFTQTYPHGGKLDEDTYLIRRITVPDGATVDDLLRLLAQGSAKASTYEDDMSEDRGWRSKWGMVQIVPDRGLVLRATPSQTGASAILDGTAYWADYALEATVETPPGSSIFIYVRHQSDTHTAACNFGNGFMHVEQVNNGVSRVVKGTKGTGPIPAGPVNVRAVVSGRTLSCTLGDKTVTSEFLDRELDRGGIGWKTWDRTPGRAELIVHRLAVQPLSNPPHVPQETATSTATSTR